MTTLAIHTLSVRPLMGLMGLPALIGAVDGFFSHFSRAVEAARTWNTLAVMSDRRLAEMGMARDDVPRAVGRIVTGAA
ncbi:MAG: DUF1127 domain-containing protein [Rhodospirillales bacterium]